MSVRWAEPVQPLRRAATRGMSSALAALAGRARDLERFAFPQRCPGCGVPAEAGRFLCEPCRARIPRLANPLCARCLSRGLDAIACRRHPEFEVWPAWVYEERAALLVHAFKYQERPDLASGLGAELARVRPPAPRPDLVVAMPLHPARRRERGYNQAALLAEALGRTCGIPHLEGVVERVRPTRPQARLDPAQRRVNVAGAFRVIRPEWVRERTVLLVDDVMTTGATFAACLESLQAAGARARGVALAWAS